jgi:hypothetical protein
MWHSQSKLVHVLDPGGRALIVRHGLSVGGAAPGQRPLIAAWARARSGGSSEQQPVRSLTASTRLPPDGGRPSGQPHRTGFASASGSADRTASRWVMEKARENARRAAVIRVLAGIDGVAAVLTLRAGRQSRWQCPPIRCGGRGIEEGLACDLDRDMPEGPGDRKAILCGGRMARWTGRVLSNW